MVSSVSRRRAPCVESGFGWSVLLGEHGTHGSTYYDFSSSYKVRDNLVITLEGINLGDKFTDAYVDTADRVSDYRHTGREILLGVRWTY